MIVIINCLYPSYFKLHVRWLYSDQEPPPFGANSGAVQNALRFVLQLKLFRYVEALLNKSNFC
jgi:hypothetical protein